MRCSATDALAHRDKLDVQAAAERVDVPWLVVHARDDEAVGFHAAETLAAKTETAELFAAEGGHTFGGAHPFDGTVRPSLKTVWTETTQFLSQHLGRS